MAPRKLAFRPVTRSRGADFEALFESPGAPQYCWCMAWRPMDQDRATAGNAGRKAEVKTRIGPAGTRPRVMRLALDTGFTALTKR